MYEIDLYEDSDGYCEILEFFHDLDQSNEKSKKVLLGKITHQLDLLQLLGPTLHEPQAKYLKGYRHPLFELRPIPERIFYAAWTDGRYVLLSHYTKKQNATDSRQVERALRLLDDWLTRKERSK
ncbi:type II toxin-antitoxin system RelE/ParE family toxin [Lacticaseibacillus nasuensis]|uniref:type II toxin-antitoxin system RelE/ParE family toxin n=1 Tax=Lacticaseibacillus nasuensis TaxID=944671 RepID=UPI0007050D9C|nr:type II toxin-antitoxin system RelE/ParE family toxin [Lacticaseibacillus nasuensis]